MSMRKCQIYKKTVWQVLARQKTILIADRSSVYFFEKFKKRAGSFLFFLGRFQDLHILKNVFEHLLSVLEW